MISMRLQEPGDVGQDRLQLSELSDCAPASDEVVVDVDACAMCRTDLQIIEGDLTPRVLPLTPGHQVVGTIVSVGADVDSTRIGQRVGLAWLANACGHCQFCRQGRENLCLHVQFTGWDVNGGYATQMLAKAKYAFDLSPLAGRDSESIAPLLCAGVIGYRAMRIAEIDSASTGKRLGLYGFGASARQVLQIAAHWGVDVYAACRTRREVDQAIDAGAIWAGIYDEKPAVALDAAITFAPVGSVVINALSAVDRGGIVAINAIHLDEIPSFNYDDLWMERSLRSVANVTRLDVVEYLSIVDAAGLQTEFEALPLARANEGLRRMKAGDLRGSFVLSAD